MVAVRFFRRLRYVLLRQGCDQTIFSMLCDVAKHTDASRVILSDARARWTYRALLEHAMGLLRLHLTKTKPADRLGLLLPQGTMNTALLCAAWARGNTAVCLQYASGIDAFLFQVHLAGVKTVYTADAFLGHLGWADLPDRLGKLGVSCVRLDQKKQPITHSQRLRIFLAARFPKAYHAGFSVPAASPACILFTSGSEGRPKGVVLSHANILASQKQLAALFNLAASDRVFHALPPFHVLGLCTATLLPLLWGVPVYLFADPLRFRSVVSLIERERSTILFGTDALLWGYAQAASEKTFDSLRYIFAGAEAVRMQTMDCYQKRFGLNIYEGYGATETCGPVAVNHAKAYCRGSVGPLLPGVRSQLHPVAGCAEGKHLWVAGPNVMLGYLDEANPSCLRALPDGWYQTGDLAVLDSDHFLHLKGRLKRFIKIGGEMVSLAFVEAYARGLWPESRHAAVACLADDGKPFVVLVTTQDAASRSSLMAYAKQEKIASLYWPKRICHMADLPLLPSGKVDYITLQKRVAEQPDQAI